MGIVIGLICVLLGGAVGALVTHLMGHRRLMAAETRATSFETRATHLASDMEKVRIEIGEERARSNEVAAAMAATEATSTHLRQKLEEEGKRIAEMQAQARAEFENLANRILEEKSAKFLSQNQEHLGALLDPLRTRIGEFKERIEHIHTEETKTSAALREQLTNLKELNQQITQEAGALTRALKGESKTQGSWGELILERILEKSGLQKGSEYETQTNFRNSEGGRYLPDVVIHLPEGKHLIIDAKVSLTAYERFVNAPEATQQAAILKEHTLSVRRHVEELSRKDYPGLPDLQSPDFVLMFVPVEPALQLALQSDPDLYASAFDRNVVLVSSSTLLITLRAIENVWRRHKQTLNALEIANKAGALHDQFVLFTESLHEIGQRLDQARGSYDQALSRLSTGRGNLVRRVGELQKLGARADKQIAASLVKQSEEDAEQEALKDEIAPEAPPVAALPPVAEPEHAPEQPTPAAIEPATEESAPTAANAIKRATSTTKAKPAPVLSDELPW